MTHSQTISLYQPVLHAIAIKMVGSLHDAEDIVQETFLKWLTIDTEKIYNTKAYLIKAVTHNSINHLNALKKKKNECLDHLHPSDLIDWYRETDFLKFDLENDISAALNIIHKKLEPIEKGIYILREVFNFEYEELQHIFDKKKDNCRQLFSRAKDKLAKETEKIKTDITRHARFFETFKNACDLGAISDFVSDVKHDIEQKLK